MKKENISIRAWQGSTSPEKILIIRIEALGDLFMTFPVVSDLRTKFPEAKIDLLVRSDYAELPVHLNLFDSVYSLKGFYTREKLFHLPFLIPSLLKNKYDIVFDLQRNFYTRLLRKLIRPKAWIEFDRFSPVSALERNLLSFNKAGLGKFSADYSFSKKIAPDLSATQLLSDHGWNKNKLILLNPAGLYETRQWPLERYTEFCHYWIKKEPNAQFVLTGISKIQEKAEALKRAMPDVVINLVGKTSLTQAYSIVLMADFMLTEDSGLAHFSWLSGKKTLMLLGGTRSDWTSPSGTHTDSFNSDDLPCGNCMRATCLHETVVCMDRLSSSTVFEKAWNLYTR